MQMLGIVGSSGSGKTTLITQILPLLRQRGLRVSALKHAHHGFDIDRPGKDSYRYREAGAEEVMLVADGRWALLHECADDDDMSLQALARRMAPVDIVLVEGFKLANIPKIEVFRPDLGKSPFFPDDRSIVAVASDANIDNDGRTTLPLNDPEQVLNFILAQVMAVP
jgi:molybdopterin-guanine dinucleotide biosynthesis adapter protein